MSPPTRRSRLPATVFMLWLSVSAGLAPLAEANHASNEPPLPSPRTPDALPPPPPPPDVSEEALRQALRTGYPTVDGVTQEIWDAHQDSMATLNDNLRRGPYDPANVTPAVAAQVFRDGFDGDRVGGIGDWTQVNPGWLVERDPARNSSAYVGVFPQGRSRQTTLLVSPAIDLSAYPAPTRYLPVPSPSPTFSTAVQGSRQCAALGNPPNGNLLGPADPARATAMDSANSTLDALIGGCNAFRNLSVSPLRDLTNLFVRHRLRLQPEVEAAQVFVFTSPPTGLSSLREGDILAPLTDDASYSAAGNSASMRDSSFGGKGAFAASTPEWRNASFDLTRYAGRTVWVGFALSTLGGSGEPGWWLDNVTVVGPAFAYDLKLVALEASPSVAQAKGRLDVAPERNFSASATVLNAAAHAHPVRVAFTLSGSDFSGQKEVVQKTLAPGEVWVASATLQGPPFEGHTARLRAVAEYAQEPDETPLPDPTANQDLSRTLRATSVIAWSVDAKPAQSIVHQGNGTVIVQVRNTGTVAGTVVLNGTDRVTNGRETREHALPLRGEKLLVPAGQVRSVVVDVPANRWGVHEINVSVDDGTSNASASTVLYLHATPPDVLAVGGNAPDPANWSRGWTPELAVGISRPRDGAYWRSHFPNNTPGMLYVDADGKEYAYSTLTLRPAFPPTEAGGSTRQYTDLQITISYTLDMLQPQFRASWGGIPPNMRPTAGIVLYYSTAAYPFTSPTQSVPGALWGVVLESNGQDTLTGQPPGWKNLTIPVRPGEDSGYVDVWDLGGLELAIKATEGVLIDDFELSGVPAGGLDRHVLARLAGTGRPCASGEETGCEWGLSPLPTAGPGWTPTTHVDAQLPSRWAPGSLRDGPAWTWTGGEDALHPDRVVSPPLNLSAFKEATLEMEHSLALFVYKMGNTFYIKEAAYVEIRGQRPDGSWTPFGRALPSGESPQGDYKRPASMFMPTLPPTFSITVGGQNSASFLDGDGWWWPSGCRLGNLTHPSRIHTGETAPGDCLRDGAVTTDNRQVPFYHWPSAPLELTSRFDLVEEANRLGLDLSREIQIGFRLAGVGLIAQDPMSGLEVFPGVVGAPRYTQVTGTTPRWLLHSVRVSGVEKGAVSASLADARLHTPYDWRETGAPPGALVPVQVTVRNDGLHPAAFHVNLHPAPRNGTPERPVTTSVALAPEESTTVTLLWPTPSVEGQLYDLRVELTPAEGFDQDPRDNVARPAGAGGVTIRSTPRLNVSLEADPRDADPRTARALAILVRNEGNVPLDGITLRREIRRDGDATPRQAKEWALAPLAPSDRWVPLDQLADVHPRDATFTPGTTGNFGVVVEARGADVSVVRFATLVSRETFFETSFADRPRWPSQGNWTWKESEGSHVLQLRNGSRAGAEEAWIELPRQDLAKMETAILALQARYDLEPGFDGVALEGSVDGGPWFAIEPTIVGQAPGYPGQLSGASPIAQDHHPRGAFTGTSAGVSPDGWIEAFVNLNGVPQLQAPATVATLRPPAVPPAGSPESWERGARSGDWMAPDPTRPLERWQVQNLTEPEPIERHAGAPSTGFGFWSGMANTGNILPVLPTITRKMPLTPAPPGAALEVSWWEKRAGGAANPDGVGGRYMALLHVSQPADVENGKHIREVTVPSVVVATLDGWTLRKMTLHDTGQLTPGKLLDLTFAFDSQRTSINPEGWIVRAVTVAWMRYEDGRWTEVERLLSPHDGRLATGSLEGAWLSTGWAWTDKTAPARPETWRVEPRLDADGAEVPAWVHRAGPAEDSRLVSPVLDLGSVGVGGATLRVRHEYNLAYWNGTGMPSDKGVVARAASRFFGGGVVEIQVFDERTQSWQPWEQLFLKAPSKDVRPAPRLLDAQGAPSFLPHTALEDGAPYTAILLDVGDSFARFPRNGTIVHQTGTIDYGAGSVSSSGRWDATYATSYVFSGDSKHRCEEGPCVDAFDLTPYAGRKVRLGFHAWASALDKTPGVKHWTLYDASIDANALKPATLDLRLRAGFDGSNDTGRFDLRRVAVSGTPVQRQILLDVDDPPAAIAPGANVTLRGWVRNVGLTTRSDLVIVIDAQADEGAPPRPRVPAELPSFEEGCPGIACIGPLALATRGPRSVSPFEVALEFGPEEGNVALDVRVMGVAPGAASRDLTPTQEDAPARSAWRWEGKVSRAPFLALDARLLSENGTARVTGALRNEGTAPANATALLQVVRTETGAILGSATATLRGVAPGQGHDLSTLVVGKLPASGNLTLKLRIVPEGGAPLLAQRELRLGVSPVAMQESFDSSQELPAGWAWTDSMFAAQVAKTSEVTGGNAVVLGMLPDSGSNPMLLPPVGVLSARVDLRAASPDAALGYWSRSFATGRLEVSAVAEDERGQPACTALLQRSVIAAQEAWEFTRLGLEPRNGCELAGRWVRFQWRLPNAFGIGWALDGVTTVASGFSVAPAAQRWRMEDSTDKTFPLVLSNPQGYALDVRVGVDPRNPVTPAQAGWVDVLDGALRLPPEESSVGRVRVRVPDAAVAPRGELPIQMTACLAEAPYYCERATLQIDVDPQPRADLAITGLANGQPIEGAKLAEGIPHTLTFRVRNHGDRPAPAHPLRVEIANATTGETIFQTRVNVPALAPSSTGGKPAALSIQWRPRTSDRGLALVRVSDLSPDVIDADPRDNSLEAVVSILPMKLPDVSVVEEDFVLLRADGQVVHQVRPGQLLTIQCTIRNEGDEAARRVTVRLTSGTSTLIEETIEALPAQSSHVLTLSQFAPSVTTPYRVSLYTGDIESRVDNNELTVLVPVLSAPLSIEVDDDGQSLGPGESARFPVRVTNEGSAVVLAKLGIREGAALASLDRSYLELEPGQTATASLRVQLPASLQGTQHPVVVSVETVEGVTDWTYDVPVREVVSASADVVAASGPPSAVRTILRLANDGNVPVAANVRVSRASDATLVAESVEIAAGEERTLALPFASPVAAPGTLPVTVEVSAADRTVMRRSVDAVIEAAPEMRADVMEETAQDGRSALRVRLENAGNVPLEGDLRLLGLPEGARSAFDKPSIHLDVGDIIIVEADVRVSRAALAGAFSPRIAILDGGEVVADHELRFDVHAARLAIEGLVVADDGNGAPRSVAVKVANRGTAAAVGVPVELYVDEVLHAASAVASLAPGAATTIHLPLERLPAGAHALLVAVDPAGSHAGDTPPISKEVVVEDRGVLSGILRRDAPAPALFALLGALALAAALRRRAGP